MQSTRVILSLKMEWNFGTWKYTYFAKKEFVQRLLAILFISRVPRTTFFDSVREAAMEAIHQIGQKLEARLRHAQEYLREVYAELMDMKFIAAAKKQRINDFKDYIA